MAKQQTALEPAAKTVPVSTAPNENIFEQLRETANSIAHRAFELFEKRGRQFGNDLEDWLKAESELVRRVPIEVKDVGNNLEIRAEIPGFKPEELRVYVEPKRLTISGETEASSEEKTGSTLYSEWRSQKVFRAFDLPREIKINDAKATLKDGILSLKLAKAEETKPQEVRIKNA